MENEFYTLASSTFPADIQILKGRLESEGIAVFLRDENTVNTDPLISDAIGGVKLQIYTTDKDKAVKIYNEIRAYARDENGDFVKCPNCGEKKSEVFYKRNSFVYKLFPFFEPKKYRCTSCQFITKAQA